MSRDIINTTIKKWGGVQGGMCTTFWFQITKGSELTVDTHLLWFPWLCRNISLCLCCRWTRGHCTCKLLRREGRRCNVEWRRETNSVAIKSFSCQTEIHQQLTCRWKPIWCSLLSLSYRRQMKIEPCVKTEQAQATQDWCFVWNHHQTVLFSLKNLFNFLSWC